jgi:hypothetical protein
MRLLHLLYPGNRKSHIRELKINFPLLKDEH